MKWYYSQQGQKQGPVSAEELDHLVATGALPPTAYVWTSGMGAWAHYQEVRSVEAVPPSAIETVSAAEAADEAAEVAAETAPVQLAAATDDADMAVCASCGLVGSSADFQWLGQSLYCPRCHKKEARRLRHEAMIHYASPAGFWVRFLARVIDSVALFVVFMGVTVVTAVVGFSVTKNAQAIRRGGEFLDFETAILVLLFYGTPVLYFAVMHGVWGASLGKFALRLRVVRTSGAPVGPIRSFLRVLAEAAANFVGVVLCSVAAKLLLESLVKTNPLAALVLLLVLALPLCFANYLWAMFSEEKKAWHDILVGTRVLKLN